jgi:FtsH-binding integral membrane protein
MLLKRVRYEKLLKTIGFVALPIWLITGVWLNCKVSMYGMQLGSFGLFIVSGLSGSLFFFTVSKYLEKNDHIRQYSKWTIFIVCSHYVLVTLFLSFSSKHSITGTHAFDLMSVIFVLLILCMYKPICEYLNNHLPILLGNKKYANNL